MGIVTALDARSYAFPRPVQPIPLLSVVVPVFNEALSVGLLAEQLTRVLDALEQEWEIVFVDDGSTDTTFKELSKLHRQHERIRVVRLRKNFGKSAALAAGFDAIRGGTVITIDGDMQDDPAEIPRLLEKLGAGFDLVSGWKATRQDPLRRRIASRVFNAVTRWISGVQLRDMNCGFKAYRVEVVRSLTLGVLLLITGFQFLSIGLIGELITTQHEERRAPHERAALRVDEILE
jgi:glycosyltransferase involved in cell wall biosynthesis